MESLFNFTSTEYISDELKRTLSWAMTNFTPGCLNDNDTYYAVGIISFLLSMPYDDNEEIVEECCKSLLIMFKNTCKDSNSSTVKDGKQIYEGYLYTLIQRYNLHHLLMHYAMKLQKNTKIMTQIKNLIINYVNFSFETDDGKLNLFDNLYGTPCKHCHENTCTSKSLTYYNNQWCATCYCGNTNENYQPSEYELTTKNIYNEDNDENYKEETDN